MFEYFPRWERAEKEREAQVLKEIEAIASKDDGSLFKVPLTTIVKIESHPNADRLSIATVYGFQVIVQKDKYNVGNQVIYIPVDSILPKWLEDKLFPEGSKITLNKSRVRQIRIRKATSQGMLIDPQDVASKVNPEYLTLEQNLAEILEVTKYEPQYSGKTGPRLQMPRNKPLENARFHKYGGIDNIKWYPNYFENQEVIIEEKLHGCVQASTKIRMADGTSKTVKEIVKQRMVGPIIGVDDDGKLVSTQITNWFDNGGGAKWLKILTTRTKAGRGKHVSKITCTTNHKFLLADINEYRQASDLGIGDRVYLLREDFDLSFVQKEILIGKMLGDGSLSKGNHITFGHKKERYKPDVTIQEIVSIDNDHHDYDRYDIETETHNYFANNILTHNSNCRAGYVRTSPNTLWKKILKFFGKLPSHEYVWGSNNVQLQHRPGNTGFYGRDIYKEVLDRVEAFSKMKPGEIIFGELVGPAVQQGYDYGHKEHHFVLFDVKTEREDGTQEYLDPEQAEAYAKERGFDFVPVLYRGVFNAALAKELSMGPSLYCPQEKVREGIVVKARTEYSNASSKKALKLISEEYLADTSNSDNH